MIRKKSVPNKQQIISEYLSGGDTFKSLEFKYGVNARTIQTWVRAFKATTNKSILPPLGLSDIKTLRKQLEDVLIKNELLEEMLRLSEEQTGLDLRKKFGARQS